jgi:NAD(P)-dependent dehydrogenase (short-subunit alcohol dehydrogenase family)
MPDRREQLAQARLHLLRIAIGVVDGPVPIVSARKLVGFHRATKIKWLPDASDGTELLTSTAIVTGGTGGLGAAVVTRLLDDGWRVVVPWGVEAELSRLPQRDGLDLVQADLFDANEVATVVAHGVADSGAPLRGLVNLVGGFAAGARVDETPIEEFEEQFRLNLRPTYLMIQSAVPQIVAAGGGSIVCVGTRAALQPFKGAAGYISSKAAVIAFAQAVAVEYRDDGVRCNAILPSVIDTPGNRASMPNGKFEKWVKPAEIAGVIAYLLSDDSLPTSGAAIPVYGRA